METFLNLSVFLPSFVPSFFSHKYLPEQLLYARCLAWSVGYNTTDTTALKVDAILVLEGFTVQWETHLSNDIIHGKCHTGEDRPL